MSYWKSPGPTKSLEMGGDWVAKQLANGDATLAISPQMSFQVLVSACFAAVPFFNFRVAKGRTRDLRRP